jgi:hypothetical protein
MMEEGIILMVTKRQRERKRKVLVSMSTSRACHNNPASSYKLRPPKGFTISQ